MIWQPLKFLTQCRFNILKSRWYDHLFSTLIFELLSEGRTWLLACFDTWIILKIWSLQLFVQRHTGRYSFVLKAGSRSRGTLIIRLTKVKSFTNEKPFFFSLRQVAATERKCNQSVASVSSQIKYASCLKYYQ